MYDGHGHAGMVRPGRALLYFDFLLFIQIQMASGLCTFMP